jgi:hypothetical protein
MCASAGSRSGASVVISRPAFPGPASLTIPPLDGHLD